MGVAHVSASFSTILRVRLPDAAGSFARVATVIGEQGASLGSIDLVRVERGHKIRDITILAEDEAHVERVVAAVNGVEGVEVQAVSDRTFLIHLGGKLEMHSRVPLKTRDDLSMAYTPGVARVSMATANDPDALWNLTIKRNTVAVVSDGTAVLGLGDIGPGGALPVMEGKAILFKEFAGVNAFPLCLDTKDVEEIILIVKAVAPVFGGINLEDISAPRCFEIERRLREMLDIPVFHDDQHGTAIVTLAALINALKVVGKRLDDDQGGDHRRRRRGRGGDEHAVGGGRARHRRLRSSRGASIATGRDSAMSSASTRRRRIRVRCAAGADEALVGADVFIGVSQPGAISVEGVARDGRARDRVRDGQPDAGGGSGVDRGNGRGRRDGTLGLPEPDQQCAGVSRRVPRRARCPRARDQRGDGGRRRARDRGVDPDDELFADYIVPSVFNRAVAPAVAAAVAQAAEKTGVARRKQTPASD